MEKIFQKFDSPSIGYWHDIGHGQIRQNLGFIGHRRWLEKLSPKLIGMHIHDVFPPAQDHIMPPNGKIVFQDFKSAIHSDTIFVLEPSPRLPAKDIVEGLKIISKAWDMPLEEKQ
jgi:sugar phosphate isomerase/epimerase